MSDPGLVILKFGGSVLRDEASLGGAVHEVYRWRRDGRRVLAVAGPGGMPLKDTTMSKTK